MTERSLTVQTLSTPDFGAAKAAPLLLSDAHAHLKEDASGDSTRSDGGGTCSGGRSARSGGGTCSGPSGEAAERAARQIPTLLCATTPPEAGRLLASPRPFLIPTAGLHPWHTDEYSVEEMKPFLEKAPVIGEIGMDSVWCSVPLKIQKAALRRQLSLASEMKKPVILHTKGQEREIAAILREYPNTYLVHWYSSDTCPEDYMALDCYFSIGPDVSWNPAVQRAAKSVPLNRLLIETDGMGAVSWAYEEGLKRAAASKTAFSSAAELPIAAFAAEKLPAAEFPAAPFAAKEPPATISGSLEATLRITAGLRHLPAEDAGALFRYNLIYGFLKNVPLEPFLPADFLSQILPPRGIIHR